MELLVDKMRRLMFDIFSLLLIYYFALREKIYYYYYKVKCMLFAINKIYYMNLEGNKKSILLNYYLYKLVSLLKIKYLQNKLNKTYFLTKVELTNSRMTRNLLFYNRDMEYIINKIKHVNYDINELMLNKNFIMKDLLLVQDDSRITIRRLIENYSDRSKIYPCHTLRNILKIKNINHENGKLMLEYIVIPEGKKYKEYNLEEILDVHISDLYDI
jgi:hypothetical protein